MTTVGREATLPWKNRSREPWSRDDVTVSRGLEDMMMAPIVVDDVRR